MSSFNTPVEPAPSESKTSGLAIASLILGIIGILTTLFLIGPLFGIVGLILGIIAVKKIGKPGQATDGKGLAIAGIATSSISVAVMLLLILPAILLGMTMPMWAGRAREIANRTICSSNLHGIQKAMISYAARNDDQFPPTIELLLDEGSIMPQTLTCRSGGEDAGYIYIYPNQGANAPGDAILMYEPLTNHNNEGTNILFGDGHIEWLPADKARALLESQGIRLIE